MKSRALSGSCFVAALTIALAVAARDARAVESNADLAKKAYGIFHENCASCHSPDGPGAMSEHALTYILDRQKLVDGKMIEPGKSDTSPVWQRISGKKLPQMPYGGAALSSAEIETVTAWINAGAPDWKGLVQP
jgi:mono/diheme cytochrome c family protein